MARGWKKGTMPQQARDKIGAAHKRLGTIPPNQTGRKWSAEEREKVMAARKNHPNAMKRPEVVAKVQASKKKTYDLRGRKGRERDSFKKTAAYIAWRKAVFERDGYKCVFCGAKNGNGKTVVLHADHIKPYARFPDLRLDVSNGRTLCKPCHKSTPTYGGGSRAVL